MVNINQRFAKVLKAQRLKKGMSQEFLAHHVGLHRTYISQLERGLKSPSLTTIYRICDILGMKVSEFIRLVDEEIVIDV